MTEKHGALFKNNESSVIFINGVIITIEIIIPIRIILSTNFINEILLFQF